MAVVHLSAGDDDGTTFGQSSTDKISFFNATPVVKQTTLPAAGTDAATVLTLANAIRANLIAYGL